MRVRGVFSTATTSPGRIGVPKASVNLLLVDQTERGAGDRAIFLEPVDRDIVGPGHGIQAARKGDRLRQVVLRTGRVREIARLRHQAQDREQGHLDRLDHHRIPFVQGNVPVRNVGIDHRQENGLRGGPPGAGLSLGGGCTARTGGASETPWGRGGTGVGKEMPDGVTPNAASDAGEDLGRSSVPAFFSSLRTPPPDACQVVPEATMGRDTTWGSGRETSCARSWGNRSTSLSGSTERSFASDAAFSEASDAGPDSGDRPATDVSRNASDRRTRTTAAPASEIPPACVSSELKVIWSDGTA